MKSILQHLTLKLCWTNLLQGGAILFQSGASISKSKKHYCKVGQFHLIEKWDNSFHKVGLVIYSKKGQWSLQIGGTLLESGLYYSYYKVGQLLQSRVV